MNTEGSGDISQNDDYANGSKVARHFRVQADSKVRYRYKDGRE